MKKIDTRFGEIEYDPQNTVRFPEGLVGLPTLKDFIVMPSKKEGPLFWIQSIDDPQMAFILTDPTNFFIDYKVIPDEKELSILKVDSVDKTYNLSVVSVSKNKEITLNLAAPILFSPESNRGLQVILENTDFSTKTKLPEIDESDK